MTTVDSAARPEQNHFSKRFIRMPKLLSRLLICATVAIAVGWGQVGTQGSITGSVTDSSGAAVVNAKIEITNLETGLRQTAVSDGAGNVDVLAISVGHYKVTVTGAGFKTWTLERLDITVGDRARIVPILQVSQLTEQVSVTSESESLQTESGAVDTVIQMQQIRELPLSNRNPIVLAGLTPGVQFTSDNTGPEHGSAIQGNGVRNTQTQFQIDGVNSNAAMDQGAMTIPNVDAIAEMSVSTNSFSAEYGRDPMQVLLVTKSGGNQFHGAVWEFFQNDALNARNAFARTVPRLRFNQFGGSVGGPIIRNKTFFYVNLQRLLNPNATVFNQQGTLPTPAMLNGDLSSVSTRIIDPVTNLPFAGNVIPQSRISSASRYLSPYLLSSPTGSLVQNVPVQHDVWDGTIRLDHEIT